MSWVITGSVGRWEKNAENREADVRVVQRLLGFAAAKLGDQDYDPKGVDGQIARPPKPSRTVAAIEAFQSRFMAKPDGLIEVGGRTWNALVDTAEGEATGEGPYFPFQKLPSANWTQPPRSFGANRSGKNGVRAHAGCDLYFPHGTLIHAITHGTVVRGPYYFYNDTYALEIDHGSFLARYGEIRKEALVKEGDHVKGGQEIARVGHLVGINVPSDMLHLELYDKSASEPLTVTNAAHSKKRSDGVPFLRRMDLIDPTPYLNKWKLKLP